MKTVKLTDEQFKLVNNLVNKAYFDALHSGKLQIKSVLFETYGIFLTDEQKKHYASMVVPDYTDKETLGDLGS
jgi:hypothetical protein